MRWLGLAVFFALLIPRASLSESLSAAAKRHYDEGTKAYNLGEFAKAAEEYKAAYSARPEAVLLYDIGQAYRLSGEVDRALFFYRSYLRNAPDASNRSEVEQRIEALEKQRVDEKTNRAPAPAKLTTPKTSDGAAVAPALETPQTVVASIDRQNKNAKKPIYKQWWFWTAGAVVIAAGVGIGVGVGLAGGKTNAPILPAVMP